MKITRPNRPIRAKINLPSSKSISNRLLLMRALSGGDFQISNLSKARDTQLLEKALQFIRLSKNNSDTVIIDIEDAGTPMRFLTAFLSITSGKWLLTGNRRICERPVGQLVSALRTIGAHIDYVENEGFSPLIIQGGILNGKEVIIDAGVSSQFISALMLIAPMLPFGMKITMTGKTSSAPYILMTAYLMEQAGVNMKQNGQEIYIEPNQYRPVPFSVEPDWSAAAFWYEIVAFSKDAVIELPRLINSGLQGDEQVREIFTKFGVKTQFTADGAFLSKSGSPVVTHFSFDFTSFPDLFLPLAVTCAGLNIDSTLSGLKSLRIKESDRINALFSELKVLGYNIVEMPGDVLRILPCESIYASGGNAIKTYNDHRMAMAFAPLAMICNEIAIFDPDVVNKSYPDFWDHLAEAGFVLEI